MFWREWTSKVEYRRGRMVPLSAFDILLKRQDTGYSTLYMFLENDAKEIKASGNSSGLSQYAVASDCLTLDIDDGDRGLVLAEAVLIGMGLKYDVWTSGGKGYHIVIPHELIISEHLPYTHRKIVEEMGLKVDLSLYQHGRLLSLPGRLHPKTKKKKAFLRTVDGKPLDIVIQERPEHLTFNFDDTLGIEHGTKTFLRLANMVEKPPYIGNRHTSIWSASKDLAGLGLEYETVVDIMIKVNDSWTDAKSHDEVKLAVSQAFQIKSNTTKTYDNDYGQQSDKSGLVIPWAAS